MNAPTRLADIPLVVGVTSHRNLAASEVEPIRQLVRDFFASLKREFSELPLVVLSALAEGGDRLVAREALAAGARLIAPLPLSQVSYAEDFIDAESRATFESCASEPKSCNCRLVRGNTLAAVAVHGEARDRQYAQAGVFVASHSHILLTLWDGHESDLLGGTAQVVRYALHGVMPGLIERRRRRTRVARQQRRKHRLPHRLFAHRRHRRAATAAGFACSHCRRAGSARHRRGRATRACRMNSIACSCACRNSTSINTPSQMKSCPRATASANEADTAAATSWTNCSRSPMAWRSISSERVLVGDARHACPRGTDRHRLRLLFRSAYRSAVPVLWNLCVHRPVRRGRAAGMAGASNDWHRKYVDYRALAEGLRVQRWWRRAGIVEAGSSAFAHDNFCGSRTSNWAGSAT